MSKQDVMALYLNEIYYGNRAYGAAAAARTFFDKRVQDLTLAEAALLAGLPQAPANLDPFNPDPSVQDEVNARWQLVLDRMVTERMITDAQRDAAIAEGYTLVQPEAPFRAPHFTVYAQSELEALLIDLGYSPDDIARGGLRVYTTIDLRLQDLAEQAARNQISSLGGLTITNGAVIVMQPLTGEIMAMIGSLDYENDAIDGRVNVTISPRQPGSTMKPFTYAAALERGGTLGDIIWDTETVIGDYRPVNYDRTFHGPVRIRTALANSYNIPAVQTLRRVGVEGLLEISARFGIESLGSDASRYGLSLTLGGGEVTLLELTRAYGVFGNSGVYVPTTAILCVVDNDDNIRYQYESGCPSGNITAQTVNETGFGQRVLDPRIAYMITDILADNNARSSAMGSNSPLNTGGIYTAVKTGTTDDFRDNWTVGYNRNLAVGVWVGNSDGTPMSSGTTGLTGAAPIWNSVINGIYSTGLIDEFVVEGGRLPDQLDAPTGMSLRRFCAINALRDPALDCGATLEELYMDTPAGLPDGQGGLTYPAPPAPTPDQAPQTGVWLREVEPSIYRVHVHPIPPNIGAALIVSVPNGNGAQFPPPVYCQVPIEAVPVDPAAREQLFIAPPQDSADAARAEQWARANNFAFLPTIACTVDLINASGAPNVITAFISQPTAGQVVYANMPILGTASFTPQQALFYKLELSGGQFGDGNWVTMGTTHNNPVVNGQLEILPGLSPGNYMLQLAVVGLDGNYVQPPYQVPFTVQ
jgi:membrane peptidoglycan carboxypeptidase